MKRKKDLFKKLLTFSGLITITFFFSQCKKDDQTSIVSENRVDPEMAVMSTSIPADAYYIEKSLPSGYVKDGSRDYTTLLQSAILKYPNIVFPAFPILINDNGLTIPSNRNIIFLDGSELRMKPTSQAGYGMLTMRNATNVTLTNPVLKGDRYKHTGTTGEWGMGISIYGGSNITVLSPEAREMWGDGIYVGVENGIIPKNITIKDAILEYNRRDGITIVAIDGLKLERPYAAFSNGTKPMAGIAFEPNNSKAEIKNVLITNPRTEGNAGHGMFVDFGNLMGGGQKTVDVTVLNHTDVKSKIGMTTMSRVSDGSSTIKGDLKFVNPVWGQNTDKAIFTILYGANDVRLTMENPIVKNINNTQLSKDATYTLLASLVNPKARDYTSITFTSIWPNMTLTGALTPIATVPTVSNKVAFAVNVGGSAFTASNGISYQADKSFSGGYLYKNSNAIANTSDDILFQSERYGTFGYSVPVTNGTYEVTLRFAEIFQSSAGKRQFDTLIEGNEVVSNLDIYKSVGKNVPMDIVKTITVTDGILNLNFRKDIDNPKLSAFHVIAK